MKVKTKKIRKADRYVVAGRGVSLVRKKDKAILQYKDPEAALRLLADIYDISQRASYYITNPTQDEIDNARELFGDD